MLSYSHQNITQDDIEVVVKALKEDFLTCGAKVEEFEKALAKYVGVKAACVLNSATSALHLAYLALNVKGKIVLTTPLTFIATSNAALMAGAKVEFIDIGTDGNIDAKKLRTRLEKGSQNIAAVAVVDFAGQSVEIDEISALCE
ncbi:aminotransferase class V-fold PLP-dependent enzyme, partial [Campylobacter upsaliensis]